MTKKQREILKAMEGGAQLFRYQRYRVLKSGEGGERTDHYYLLEKGARTELATATGNALRNRRWVVYVPSRRAWPNPQTRHRSRYGLSVAGRLALGGAK